MKKDLHPKYEYVVFQDEAAGFAFLSKSTATSSETIKWEDGKEYPLIKIHISSASHPFFTGEEKIIDTEGRVDRFKARQEAARKYRETRAAKSPAPKPTDDSAETKDTATDETKKTADNAKPLVNDAKKPADDTKEPADKTEDSPEEKPSNEKDA
jgi:large subunit ribosomal protein L31